MSKIVWAKTGTTVDHYVLGVASALLGMDDVVPKTLRSVREGEPKHLFDLGVRHAPRHTIADVASTIYYVWMRSPEALKRGVLRAKGPEAWAEVMEAIQCYDPAQDALGTNDHIADLLALLGRVTKQ